VHLRASVVEIAYFLDLKPSSRGSGRVEDNVACWFIDTDYDGDSFFVRHAYFLGGKDPYEKLKTALKADVDENCQPASTASKAARSRRNGKRKMRTRSNSFIES
jgi:hypothetical protein